MQKQPTILYKFIKVLPNTKQDYLNTVKSHLLFMKLQQKTLYDNYNVLYYL